VHRLSPLSGQHDALAEEIKAAPPILASLRHRNYRLYWFGQMFSLVGTFMQTIGQAWLVLFGTPFRPLTRQGNSPLPEFGLLTHDRSKHIIDISR